MFLQTAPPDGRRHPISIIAPWRVSLDKKPSTAFSQEHEVGVKIRLLSKGAIWVIQPASIRTADMARQKQRRNHL